VLLLLFIAGLIMFGFTKNKPEEMMNMEISFLTTDSVLVYGNLEGQEKEALTVILFHQARSNARGEYGSIIPQLRGNGYNVLSIDQRSGGQLFGSYNRTVAGMGLNGSTYCDAYPDLEATMDFFSKQDLQGKVAIWGSSYSAALVLKLAHDHPETIDAVLAFSPASGDPMGECQPNGYFDTLDMPVLVLRPESEMEYDSVKEQFELVRQSGHQVYVAKGGVHGSSMLVEERTNASVTDTWGVVLKFLGEIAAD